MNKIVWSKQNYELFLQKTVNNLWQSIDAILKDLLVTETIVWCKTINLKTIIFHCCKKTKNKTKTKQNKNKTKNKNKQTNKQTNKNKQTKNKKQKHTHTHNTPTHTHSHKENKNGSLICVTRLKVAPSMADPISLNEKRQ